MKQRSHRGCVLYGIGFFVGMPLLLVVIGLLVIAGRERASKRMLNERLDKIVAQGSPVDDATMLNFTNRLTSTQDTKAWLAVLGELTSTEFTKSAQGVPIFSATAEIIVPPPEHAWAEEKVTRDFLATWSELEKEISRLSMRQLEPQAKSVRFLTEFNSLNTLLPQTQNMRSAARLLMLRGQVAIYDRNSAKAKQSIEALLGCSRTIAGEPILVSQLVHMAIDSMAMDVLRSALNHDVLSERDLIALLPRVLDGINISPQWKIAMQGERAMMLPVFKHPELATGSETIRWLPGRSSDTLHYLDFIEQVLAVPDGDFDQFHAGLIKVELELKSRLDGTALQKYDRVMTAMMAPAVVSAGNAFISDAVQHRMAALCIGLRLYEKRNARMPSSLDELTSLKLGELNLDAKSLLSPGGQPFGYRMQDDQVLLWGFDLNQASTTPPEPPSTVAGEPNAEMNKRWIWTLKTQER